MAFLNRVLGRAGLRLVRSNATVGINRRRVAASRSVFDHYDGVIQAGPLAGTRLARQFAWGDASVGAVVLGCYEQQLHSVLEQLVERRPDVIVNIGSAEGTYAVGLARRVPEARVLAVDVEPAAVSAVRANADLNGVGRQVEPVGGMSVEELDACLARAERPAVFIDCEGCEAELLDPTRVPGLALAAILVEVHEDLVPGITELLRARLEPSHRLTEIVETGRNPHQYDVLRPMPSVDKWLLVCEGRQQTMSWFWCEPLA